MRVDYYMLHEWNDYGEFDLTCYLDTSQYRADTYLQGRDERFTLLAIF